MSGNKELPNNTDAEKWLLGGILQDPNAMAQYCGSLAEDDFFWHKHGKIWTAMQQIQKSGKPIDIITLGSELERMDSLDSAGGKDYLFSLQEAVLSAANADYYVEIIKDLGAKRKVYHACELAMEKASDKTTGANECIESVLESVAGIAKAAHKANAERIGETAIKTLAAIEQNKQRGKATGIMTDFRDIDRITGGLRKDELVILGARPGVGKTSLALDIGIKAACNSGPVLMFSMEMTREQLSSRAMCYYSKISLKKTIDSRLDMKEMEAQKNAVNILQGVPLYILYERNLNIHQISAISHSYAAKLPISLVIVDHLQIINTNAERRNYENRNIALGEITRMLKVLSGKLGCSVLALSQLNRDNEKMNIARVPRISDLRDSGNIEQDADCVILMHRLVKNTDKRDITDTDIFIAKNRSGPTGEIKIHFNPSNAMFTDMEEYHFN